MSLRYKLKQFLKPTKKKLLLTILLTGLTFAIPLMPLVFDATITYRGLPFSYLKKTCGAFFHSQPESPSVDVLPKGDFSCKTYLVLPPPICLDQQISGVCSNDIILPSIVADAVVWYILACLLIWLYTKRQKEHDNTAV